MVIKQADKHWTDLTWYTEMHSYMYTTVGDYDHQQIGRRLPMDDQPHSSHVCVMSVIILQLLSPAKGSPIISMSRRIWVCVYGLSYWLDFFTDNVAWKG